MDVSDVAPLAEGNEFKGSRSSARPRNKVRSARGPLIKGSGA